MKKLLIGTGNPGKLKVYKKLLAGLNLQILSSKDLEVEEPHETAATFEQTAIEKAKYYYEKTGIPTIVDDGGFEIDALNGEPGIKSKRWIGREMSDEEIIEEVFKRMKGVVDRTSKHTIVMALATPFGVFTASAQVVGRVADMPSEKREPGFPYRSVLFLPNYNKYWIDLNEEEEEILNHRRHALEKLKDILQELSQ